MSFVRWLEALEHNLRLAGFATWCLAVAGILVFLAGLYLDERRAERRKRR